MRRILIAPDSFKGTLTAAEAAITISNALHSMFPDIKTELLPLSDGGEGLTEALIGILGGKRVPAVVTGPQGVPINAYFGLLPGEIAVVETAAAAGLTLMDGRPDPLTATTRGVGELLVAASQSGVKHILLGLGGSATNDGGIGMASALGFRFYDAAGGALTPLAKNLSRIARIERPKTAFPLPVIAAADVTNPLCGKRGASAVFGPQKGASIKDIALLDAGLAHLAVYLRRDLGKDILDLPGAGAAGGLGAGVVAFLGGILQPGIDLILDAAGFDEKLPAYDFVITGEGRADAQSADGKVISGVAHRASMHGVPCIALCGTLGAGAKKLSASGITALFGAVSKPYPESELQARACGDLTRLTKAAFRLLHI